MIHHKSEYFDILVHELDHDPWTLVNLSRVRSEENGSKSKQNYADLVILNITSLKRRWIE